MSGRQFIAPDVPVDDLRRVDAIVGDRWLRLRQRHVFITGGTGFVGKWLLAALISANRRLGLDCRIRVLTRDPSAVHRHTPWLADAPEVTLQAGDVRGLQSDGTGFDALIHAATDVATAMDSLATFETCVQGTRSMLEFARRSGIRRVLLVSSGAVYGAQPIGMRGFSETYEGGPSLFGRSAGYAEGKRAAEFLCGSLATDDIGIAIARLFTVIGPHLPLNGPFAAGQFLRDALDGRQISINGDGSAVRSYLHASDMTAWLWTLFFEGESLLPYNVGSSEAVSIRGLAEAISRISGTGVTVRMNGFAAPGLAVQRYVPDNSRIMSRFALPPLLSLDTSIERTLRWLRLNVPPQDAAAS